MSSPSATEVASPAGELAGPAIRSTGLSKRFRGGQLAVDSVDLEVPRGSVYGFLGPNGSGKTTTIRRLLGLIYPTSGRHELLGTPMPDGAVRVLPRVGSLVEGPAFYPFLNGQQNLARCDAADRTADPRTARQRIDTALDRVGLLAAASRPTRSSASPIRVAAVRGSAVRSAASHRARLSRPVRNG